MEYHLAERIHDMRDLGVPVETWMVRADAKQLLYELHPKHYPDPMTTDADAFPFKASDPWLFGFFSRVIDSLFAKLERECNCEYD